MTNAAASIVEIGVYFPMISEIFSIFKTIYTMAEQANKNKNNCKKAANRCKIYQGVISECANAHKENGVSKFNWQQNKGLRELGLTLSINGEILCSKEAVVTTP